MVLIVVIFGYKPIKKKLEQRKEYVQKNIDDSKKELMNAKEASRQAEENIKASRVEANNIVEKAHAQALQEQKEILDEANRQAALKEKQGQIELEEQKALLERQSHNKIVEAAIGASKEILGREINEKDNEKLVDEFIDKLDKDNDKQ